MDEEKLCRDANAWELSHGGRSGRSAKQFIDHLLGTMEEEEWL
jgi:predicted AAA+ superfamily ATPase